MDLMGDNLLLDNYENYISNLLLMRIISTI